MKVSRSNSRPRRMKGHGGGAVTMTVALLAIAGSLAYLGNELGWWGTGRDEGGGNKHAGGGSQLAQSREAAASPAATGGAPATRTPVTDGAASVVPNGTPIPIPRFGREFEDALSRGAFREAEATLAGIGGAADAERRLATAMGAATRRIAARFDELKTTSGERSARVYLNHQLLSFPDRAPARTTLEALLAPPEPDPATVARTEPAPTSRPAADDASTAATPGAGGPSDVELLAMKTEAIQVMDRGEIKAALSVLREVALAAEARQRTDLAVECQRLVRQGEAELRFRQAVVERVASNAIGERPVPHLPGETGRIVGADEDGITLAGQKGHVTLKWKVLPVHTVAAMIPLLELTPSQTVDAAVTLARAGRGADADALLASAGRAGGDAVKDAIDQALADGRGMSIPPGGFQLVDGRWLSPQEVARHQVATTIARSTKDLAAADPAVRRAAFTAMLKLGDAAKSPLQRALVARRAEIRADLKHSGTWNKLADLAERRHELDQARADALELIEDETRYPYPYRPPEATPEQYKAYLEAQQAIDTRVAALRTLWNQPLAVSLPKPFLEKVGLLAECAAFLGELGAPSSDQDPAWLLHLPPGSEVTVRTIATSESDRRRIDESGRVLNDNATRATKASAAELRQARLTNEYRVMMGRAAVIVHDQLTMAARGHCEDMARKGFFAHMSPVAGKTTPYDRVRLTGMRPIGVSENIAQASGPDDAHNGWSHSSGHHRNLLAAGWKLLGVGNAGHLWCQNFAAGERAPDDPDDGGDEGQ